MGQRLVSVHSNAASWINKPTYYVMATSPVDSIGNRVGIAECGL